MVSQGLTEAALQQWDNSNNKNRSKDPPGDLCRDPPGATMIEVEMNTRLGSLNLDKVDPWSSRDESSEDESDLIGKGDDEDDGLYIGADGGDGSDDSTIAFSDIVLPTEEEDPFLIELAEAAVQEAVEQVELEQSQVVLQAKQAQEADLGKAAPTEHPNPTKGGQARTGSVPFSAHVLVQHSFARRKKEIMNMSQAELLEQLNKRLRPYMQAPLKMPPIRPRKRPNCTFFNHMGTRKAPMPPQKKRKVVSQGVQVPRKKRAMPTLPLAATSSPDLKPHTITAPSSPVPAQKKALDSPILPELVSSGVGGAPLLPSFLTDSQAWEKDLVDSPRQPKDIKAKDTASKTAPRKAPSTVSPPLMPVENRKAKTPTTSPKPVKKTVKGKKESTKKRVKVCPPARAASPTTPGGRGENTAKTATAKTTPTIAPFKRKTDAPMEVELAMSNMLKKDPMPAEKRIPLKKAQPPTPSTTRKRVKKTAKAAKKDAPSSDPPGTMVTPEHSKMTCDSPELNIRTVPDTSCKLSLDHFAGPLEPEPIHDDTPIHFEDEPLLPSLENSFQIHHDYLASLLRDDSNPEHNSKTSTPDTPIRLQRSVPSDVLIPLHDDLPSRRRDAPAGQRTPGASKPSRGPVRGMPRPMLLSPEMDILSPSTRYASHGPRFEVRFDEPPSLSPSSPHLSHTAPRRVIPMQMASSPKMPMYHASSSHHHHPIPLEVDRMYYHQNDPPPLDAPLYDDWEPLSTSRPSSPTPYVTPDTTLSPSFRRKVLEPGRDDWVMQRDLPCPPLTKGPSQQRPLVYQTSTYHKEAKPAPAPLPVDKPNTTTAKKPKAPRKKKSESAPKQPKTKKATTKKATSKQQQKQKQNNDKQPVKKAPSPPTVSPVRSTPKKVVEPTATPHAKIDYSEFRKVMSLRSGRTVDHFDDLDSLEGLDIPTLSPTAA